MTKIKSFDTYEKLKELSIQIHTFSSILALLQWDQETYMPPGSNEARSQQIALLSESIHKLKTGTSFRSLLEKLITASGKPKRKGFSTLQKVALREWHKEFTRSTKLPASFVREFSHVTSEATQVWMRARKENQFSLFAPFLQKIIDLNCKKAEILGFSKHPYDALLESYEPCVTTAKLNLLFDRLRKALVTLLRKIQKAPQIDDHFLHGCFPAEEQQKLSAALLKQLPIDLHCCRLDLSTHPFSTTLHPTDSRITTRIHEEGFMSNLFSILHEVGHSLYDTGLPAEHFGTPLAEPISLSIHESQSRWWETLIGRSRPFWAHQYCLVQNVFKELKEVPLDTFYRAIHKVEPSFIRVEADEITYCLHVILRFELEKALISKELKVADLPAAWNQKMEEYLGITPSCDAEGCLQDVHWSIGCFGYFPTYALGNLFAAHFFSTFKKDHPDWEKKVASGDLVFIRDWLKTHIHSKGRQYNAEQLAKKITHLPFNERAYCKYLEKKYEEIYKIKT